MIKTFYTLDSCFISKTEVAVLFSPFEINIISAKKDDNSKTSIKFKKEMNIIKIYSSNEENIILLVAEKCIAQFDVKKGKMLCQLPIE